MSNYMSMKRFAIVFLVVLALLVCLAVPAAAAAPSPQDYITCYNPGPTPLAQGILLVLLYLAAMMFLP